MGPSTSSRRGGGDVVVGAAGDDDVDDVHDVRSGREEVSGTCDASGGGGDGGDAVAMARTSSSSSSFTMMRSHSFDLTTRGRRKSGDGASLSSRATTPEPFELQRAISPPPTVLSKLQKWGDYQSLGSAVRGTRIVPMKTPLAEKYFQADATTFALTISSMLAEQRALGQHIGMIIDLSNHDCLYEGEVPDGIERVHVRNVAKSVPSVRDVKKALDAITRFTATDDRYVAIHCAYGFNRTGFIVCCYLVEVCGLTVDEALARFSDARAPGVKHQNFIDALCARYINVPESPEMVRLTAQLFRVSSSVPDMLAAQVSGENETLDLDINRKFHWRDDRGDGGSPSGRSAAGKAPRSPLFSASPS